MLFSAVSHSQSMVAEINWNTSNVYYHGLLILNPNNTGTFHVRFVNPYVGLVQVRQNAVLSNTYDLYGNCTSFVNCSYPKTTPYVPYSADNFIFYPNGMVYTQDYQGKWSTAVACRSVARGEWDDLFEEFGLE